MSYVVMRTLRKNVDAAFELVSDVLLNPAFAPEEIERIRHDRLTQILQQKDNPGALAIKVFFDAVYGAAHPYGYLEVGTEESNRAITRDQIVRFYQAGYLARKFRAGRGRGYHGIRAARPGGKISWASWNGRGSGSPKCPRLAGTQGRRIVIVEKAGCRRRRCSGSGMSACPASNPDYVAIDVMNTALGGLFSSRINLNLREKHGYTYGASSAFVFRRGPGPFLIGTAVRTDVTAPR